jgi:hypothetical protein
MYWMKFFSNHFNPNFSKLPRKEFIIMYLERVKERLAVLKLASPDELKGCSNQEVWQLERQLGVKLPQAVNSQKVLVEKP